MRLGKEEILETIRMIELESFDIRTVTMGISLLDCSSASPSATTRRLCKKIAAYAGKLVRTAKRVEDDYGVPIVNQRVSITPLALVLHGSSVRDYVRAAQQIDRTIIDLGIDFVGGYSALVQSGITPSDALLMSSLPETLSSTHRVCSSINLASSSAGINMDAVLQMGQLVKRTSELTADHDGLGCAKLVVFANAPENNPFMAGAFHGAGLADCTINVGISGPGVILRAVQRAGDCDFGTLSETIKRMAFKITRVGELVGREMTRRLGVEFGIIDLSLAPTPAQGDSVADILEALGLERCGTHGTTAALALLTDAVKKGGAMASCYVGGLSGAFIPVSEDAGMVRAAEDGALCIDKLEAMTSVCSVGLDMIAIPGDTPAETISGIIADEAAIGVINRKTTGVRVVPAPGKKAGDHVHYGGLLGSSVVMPLHEFSCARLVRRGGRIPAPVGSLTN